VEEVLLKDFREVVKSIKWMQYHEYMKIENKLTEEAAKHYVELKRKLRKYVEEKRLLENRLKKPSEKELKEALKRLVEGKVCGVDGTLSIYPTPTGARCRIGVVIISYTQTAVTYTTYVADQDFIEGEAENIAEYLKKIEETRAQTRLLYKTIMLYYERHFALQTPHQEALVHGPLLPLEFRLRLKTPGLLEKCLELSQKIVESKKLSSVITRTSRLRAISLGLLLEPGEYIVLGPLSKLIKPRGLPRRDRPIVEEFLKTHGEEIVLCVYKTHQSPYLAECHEDRLEKAMATIIADSQLSAKGFPLLIEYADKTCKTLLNTKIFKQKLSTKILQLTASNKLHAL